jgi:heptosyltransferase III
VGPPRDPLRSVSALFYHAGALGDFLCILPVIAAWRSARPRERVILLGKPAFGELARLSGYIDDVWDVAAATNAWLFSLGSSIPQNARTAYCTIDTAIIFTAEDSPVTAQIHAAGVRNVFGQPPFPDRRMPMSLHHLSLLPGDASESLTRGDASESPSPVTLRHRLTRGDARQGDHLSPLIRPNHAFEQDALALMGGVGDYIAIHPGSGSEIKNWPFENFSALSEACKRKDYQVVWIYGEAERDFPPPHDALVVRAAPLPILVHVLKRSKAYVGNDSGISHLAAAVGCGCTILFGPSDEVIWGPCVPNVTIIKAGRSCSPCHPFQEVDEKRRHPGQQCPNPCMRDISVEAVIETALKMIK